MTKLACVGLPGVYSLSVLDADKTQTKTPTGGATDTGRTVKHYRIRSLEDGGCYISPRKQFQDVEQLIQHYSRKNIIEIFRF